MALRLCAQLPVAIDDDGREPGALRRVLCRDLFECLKRGLQLIERLTDLTILGGDSLKVRLACQPGVFVGLSLRGQTLQLMLRLPDFFVLCAKLAVRISPLAGELRLELRFLLAGPPTIGGDDVQRPNPARARIPCGPW